MLIDIDRIVVNDRIRKDFGDLEELAEDIRQNTLLNALVVTPSGNGSGTYILIAGERRLRAMRDILGYKAVPVNVVGVDDAEQALLMEISENECRKEFTKTERLEYARRLAQIEAAKAKGRMEAGEAQDPVANLPQGKTRDIVAGQLGTSATQLRREQFIADNAEMLDPADFADWDEGRLSTNKAFQRIKAAMAKAERERDEARDALSDARAEIDALEHQNDDLYALAHQAQVVEREVVREVVPDDYEDVKRRARELEGSNRLYAEDNERLRRQLEESEAAPSGEHEWLIENARREIDAFKNMYGSLEELADVIAAMDAFLAD